ncbi:MAG: tRNA lysidine(34) synthetase TilS [candidate division Zixibacteria bacterium]|nr:tRNA lysidine(34) synthetase TilS [candidate division Zixibacteria bacterium]
MKTDCDMLQKVSSTIRRYSLIEKGDSVLVGFSGGPDSVALLHLLNDLKSKLKLKLGAVYVNHQLRPRAAKKEERFCHEFCEKLGISFFSTSVNIPDLSKTDKTGIEETARKYRYEAMQSIAEKQKFTKIAVGHHSDDRVETIIFNFCRGAGRHGIIGFQPIRDNIIRPLYEATREEILRYLKDNQLEYLTDLSNLKNQFTRNRIRRKIIPLICKEISGSAPSNIIRFSHLLSDEDRFLSDYTAKIYKKIHRVSPGGKNSLDLRKKLEYDVWLMRRLLFQLLLDAGLFDIEFAQVERLRKMLDGSRSGRMQLASKRFAEYTHDELFVYSMLNKMARTPVSIPGDYSLDYPLIRVNLTLMEPENVSNIKGTPQNICFADADRLIKPLSISGLKPGGRFHPFGRPGSKKAGDFLTDIKYPRPLRDELPVLYDKKGIVWLAGVELANRAAVTAKTRKILKIEIGKHKP